jgi:hypothetical protein
MIAIVGAISPLSPSPARAEAPEIVYQFPEDDAVLKEPPPVLQMCFKEPVNVQDLDKGGDFRFRLERPDGIGLGMRIVFQPDGYGVAIYPGEAQTEPPDGEWDWDYRLVDAASGDPLEGEVRFTVQSGEGQDIILSTPPACLASGATHSPTRSPGSGSDGTPKPTDIVIVEEPDDDGPDVALLALLTIGAAGIAGVVALLGFLIRRRTGFWLHRPPERGDEMPPDEHH